MNLNVNLMSLFNILWFLMSDGIFFKVSYGPRYFPAYLTHDFCGLDNVLL